MRLISLLLIALPVIASAETVTWQNDPISVRLSEGEARKITLPGTISNVAVREPVKQASEIVRLPGADYFHWRATRPFQDEIAIVTIEGNRNYQLRVSVDNGPAPEPLVIDDTSYRPSDYDMATDLGLSPGDIDPGSPPPMTTPATPTQQEQPPRRAYGYEELVRYAAQHHLGPARLITPLAGVTAVPVTRKEAPLLRFFQGKTIPLASYTDGEVFVTTLALYNTSSLDFEMDVRWLRGRWLFFVPPVKMPSKVSIYNHDFAFVVSRLPFWQALAGE